MCCDLARCTIINSNIFVFSFWSDSARAVDAMGLLTVPHLIKHVIFCQQKPNKKHVLETNNGSICICNDINYSSLLFLSSTFCVANATVRNELNSCYHNTRIIILLKIELSQQDRARAFQTYELLCGTILPKHMLSGLLQL